MRRSHLRASLCALSASITLVIACALCETVRAQDASFCSVAPRGAHRAACTALVLAVERDDPRRVRRYVRPEDEVSVDGGVVVGWNAVERALGRVGGLRAFTAGPIVRVEYARPRRTATRGVLPGSITIAYERAVVTFVLDGRAIRLSAIDRPSSEEDDSMPHPTQ